MGELNDGKPLFRWTNRADTFYFLYFLLHIPITILIDSALVINRESRFSFQNQLVDYHLKTNRDFLLGDTPFFLVVFGWIEMLFQLPLFFIAPYYLIKRSTVIYPYMAVYGLVASSTTLVCLCYILAQGAKYGLSSKETNNLIFIYLPTFVIPLYMLVELLGRYDFDDGSNPDGTTEEEKKER